MPAGRASGRTISGGDLCIPPHRSVTRLFREQSRRLGDRTALRSLSEGGAADPASLSWGQWEEESRAVSAALLSEGVETGEAVAILAGNRPLWPIFDLGAVGAGALSAGLYPTSAPSQIREVLDDCRARVVAVDTPERLARLLEIRDDLTELRRIVVQDPGVDGHAAGRDGNGGGEIVPWEDWLAAGRAALDAPDIARQVDRRWERPGPDDDAVLIYTSGSTGRPKGARISHRYLLASAASIRETLGLGQGDRALSYLPFCHAAERVFGLYTRILCGMEAGLVEDHRCLWPAARTYRPTVFGGLPRFFEKIHAGVRDGRETVADFLGPDVRLATSGGATLSPSVVRGLRDAGLTVLGAYGLTEHLCVSFNRPGRSDPETAGPPMPGTEIRLADDGEILVRRGPLTFSGYLDRPAETREAFTEDGAWLRTGDLGEVDDAGFLRVTGRKKELLALSTGKKVAPRPVEERLASDPWIQDAVLVGEGRKFVGAVVVPNPDRLRELDPEAAEDGPFGDVVRSPALRRRIQDAVDRVNRDLSRTERIRRFAVLDRPFSAERGELTPTGKVRRFQVVANHADLVEALYDDAADTSEAGGAGGGEGPEETP